ncbi:hypothetical protein BDF22DRAFT_698422 [Syncephalis plumigaleata]|nr:hypothetical protein BDF22DRAFT_698422 [Syncephalis plumigaleata]
MPLLLTILLCLLGLGVVVGSAAYIIIQRALVSPPTPPASNAYKRATEKRAMIVVLGDIGHSPRMQYHARSLMEHGYQVDMVGYSGAQPLSTLLDSPLVHFHYLVSPPRLPANTPKLLFLAYAPFKIIYQVLVLIRTMLWTTPSPDFILIQNPPAIPLLVVARLVAGLRRSRLIIDWHNFGYTILGLNLGARHPVVRIAEWYERIFGGNAYAHLCVTKAMALKLRNDWQLCGPIYTLYDRAPDQFHRLDLAERHELFTRLAMSKQLINTPVNTTNNDNDDNDNDVNAPIWTETIDSLEQTLWTERASSQSVVVERSNRPALLVTATSSADIGISLHASSSGLDLPMKVVDMFGCGLPVCALNFNCIDELVQPNSTGLLFDTSNELADQLEVIVLCYCHIPSSTRSIDRLRRNITTAHQHRWTENWNSVAWPLFTSNDRILI